MAEKLNPFAFLQQVRSEVSKVTWPTRREAVITTAMVFVFVIVTSMFFLLADQLMGWTVSKILGLGA